ncbi:SAM-dependent methyltransferase [Paenibacillus selenitireducens]|uniref:SAM-dependent methyltransferase n=1 Tax=Paenibacillus selenitireducens TaxID=1324314 RepID=A0A1T2XF36_9BACL|nr:SAM-dependent methyltransferase [Paenibacillus selenitireducens]OPA78499.1 SAM-dependent methyltransferase [Paenibacillus selenitireducens]
MRNFTKDTAKKILANEISVEALLQLYPEYKDEVLKELRALKNTHESNLIDAIINKYTASAKNAGNKISKSGLNEKTVSTFLPEIIKARFAIYLLEQLNVAVSSKEPTKNVRFNLWDGTILQKLLFKQGFERKPVSLGLFKFFWRFIVNKQILMPLVNKKGIYCFYSKALIKELSSLIGDKKCLEIAAGDGTLTRFLKGEQMNCLATDDYSWEHYIKYPGFVEKADAKNALHKYNPEVVLCSWPVPKNSYEKHVFKTNSVDLYIVIGTKNPAITGDFDTYNSVDKFTMEINDRLSSLLLPPSEDNAVYIFRRVKQ